MKDSYGNEIPDYAIEALIGILRGEKEDGFPGVMDLADYHDDVNVLYCQEGHWRWIKITTGDTVRERECPECQVG